MLQELVFENNINRSFGRTEPTGLLVQRTERGDVSFAVIPVQKQNGNGNGTVPANGVSGSLAVFAMASFPWSQATKEKIIIKFNLFGQCC